MKRITLTRGKYAIVDDDDFDWLNGYKWQYLDSGRGNGYAVRALYLGKVNGKDKYGLKWMHREILKTPKSFETDHINRNKLDNRKENLRKATRSQNKANTNLTKANKSGYKGVNWSNKTKSWEAGIKINQKRIWLGYFKNKLKASLVYKKAANIYFGEYASG